MAIHESRFRVRFYECDAYGHVNHTNYLRYMQEAAFAASAAVGYDFARYRALASHWLVVQTGITYLAPLRYNDIVVVKTWVSDFRRATSRRRYELRIEGSGEMAAEGYSDWIYIDDARRRPQRIPAEMAAAFSPPSGLPAGEEREPFPDFPPPPRGKFRMRRRVRWSEIDGAGHMNNAAYLALLEDCAMALMAERGWPAARLHAAGLGIVARSYRLQYVAPALLDDELEIATWVSGVKRTSATRHYEVRRPADGRLLLRAQALWVCVDLQKGRPVRIPEGFMVAFADNVSDV